MIRFLVGPAKSGKTSTCYQAIKEALKQDAYHNLIMLVPEQFNLQVQLELTNLLSPGLLRVEVMSFNNLAERVLKEVGTSKEPMIDDLERMMILKKLLEDHRQELKYFKAGYNSEGFIDGMNRLITIFEQNAIDEQVLEDLMAQESVSDVFKCKLEDMAHIRTWFETYIQDRFMTNEKMMERLAKAVRSSHYLKDATLWIDGFYGFTVPQMQVLEQLFHKVCDVTVTLPMDRIYTQDSHVLASNPFADSIYNYKQCLQICAQQNMQSETHFMEGAIRNDTPFEYLKVNYLKSYIKRYQTQENREVPLRQEEAAPQQDEIQVLNYSTREEEVEQTARRIKYLVREKGYRYSDMAILVGDLPTYHALLTSTCFEYEIPVFMDDKKSIHTNALVAVVMALLELVSGRWTYKNTLSLLKTGMMGFSQETVDLLDNYLLAHGIQGESKWRTEWLYKDDVAPPEVINPIREAVLTKIDVFKVQLTRAKADKKSMTIGEVTRALYTFMEAIDAEAQIDLRIAYYEAVGDVGRQEEYTQVYGQVIEVLERLVDLLGEETITLRAYTRLMQTTLSYVKMGVIPAAKDQLLIGTVDRTRLPNIKALFVLGVNEGLIPKLDDSMNLFSEMDKLTLQLLNTSTHHQKDRLADVIVNQPLYASQFILYALLTAAQESLVISTVSRDGNGKSIRPSMVYYKLKKMFGESTMVVDDLDAIQMPLPTMTYVGKGLRHFLEEGDTAQNDLLWQQTMNWYMAQPIWRERLIGVAEDMFYTNQPAHLSEENRAKLYPDGLQTSVSQLETYRQCPCCYFIQYGMKASERKLFEWNAADLGTLFHNTLERYPEELHQIGRTWVNASEEEQHTCVEKAVTYSVTQSQDKIRMDGRMRYTLAKVTKMSKRAIGALTYQLKQGDFVPHDYEVGFGYEGLPPITIALDATRSIVLKGKIDRVDLYIQDNETQYVKILDYKSGSTQFNLLEVYHALQFQLLLYLDAYLRSHTQYKPAGMFYFHVNAKNVKYELGMDKEALLDKQQKQFRLSGLALDDPDILRLMDADLSGEIVPAKVKKDGTLSATSSVASEKQFELIRSYMIERIKEIGREMLSGCISARPYKLKNKEGCSYCKYHTICQFDTTMKDNAYDQLADLKNQAIWESIMIKQSEGGDAHGMDSGAGTSNQAEE